MYINAIFQKIIYLNLPTHLHINIYFCKLGVTTDKTDFLVYSEFLANKNYFIKLKLNQQPAEEILIAKH